MVPDANGSPKRGLTTGGSLQREYVSGREVASGGQPDCGKRCRSRLYARPNTGPVQNNLYCVASESNHG